MGLQAYRAQGGIVILLTNAPRPASSVKTFLDRIGGYRVERNTLTLLP